MATVFIDIGGQTYLPMLVEPSLLLRANARLQGSDSLSKLAGPAVAGAVIGMVGSVSCLAVGSVAFALSAVGRARITTTEPDPVPALTGDSLPRRMGQAAVFIWLPPLVRPLVCSAAPRG